MRVHPKQPKTSPVSRESVAQPLQLGRSRGEAQSLLPGNPLVPVNPKDK